MRTQFLTTLVAASLALAAHSHPHNTRKSLSFGPVLPRAGLVTLNNAGFTASSNADPFDVATALVKELTEYDFVLRKDSYTDAKTGVTHVYFRQRVNGIEVADGDINVNVRDGMVLSYGNSFYRGAPPQDSGELDFSPRADHCNDIIDQFSNNYQAVLAGGSQQVMRESITKGRDHVNRVINTHCAPAPLFEADHPATELQALLAFMVTASPDAKLSEDLRKDSTKYINQMTMSVDYELLGTGAWYQIIYNVPGAVSPVKTRMAYVQVPKGEETILTPVFKYEVEMQDNWYEAAVSVHAPHDIISVVDWAVDAHHTASYNTFAWGINDPSEGKRSHYKETPDSLASPAGWHALPEGNDPQSDNYLRPAKGLKWRNTTTTYGNNVFAHENWEGRNSYLDNYRPSGGEKLSFDYTYDPKETADADALDEAKKYINNTITQLFVTSNLVHDFLYRYGFDEVSGNFQQYNFGRGGKENDGVIANAQDGSGYNNANFMTPPDGQNGRCRMYLWNTANPYRDGDLEAGIVIHELAHGLSTRLTGGPADSSCLGWGESGGMGEGWGDFLATSIRAKKDYKDYAMGDWAANRPNGIRNFPYSLNESVNPSTYKTLDQPGYWGVHAIGEVWAQILWVVSYRLIDVHGFSETLWPPAPDADGVIPEGDFYRPRERDVFGKEMPLVPKHGNTLAVQLVLNGMKLQPCRPSFFDARDAIIQADQVLTGGENFCALWEGFSSRGLGPGAKVVGRTPWGGGRRTNGFKAPEGCKTEKIPEDDEL